jgi:NhaC family Na+:H+ antiporter
MNHTPKSPSLTQALAPIVFLIGALSLNVYIFGDTGLEGSNQMVLILSSAVAALIAGSLGFTWNDLQEGAVRSITAAMPSMLILLLIGSLAGTWMISGIVPALIYYGLKILNPVIFLFAACVVCSIVSIATGSSWSTVATIGIALLGIGKALDIHEGLVAGAIISGAYFGDKMSPLSDTTNLAPAVAGTDLFTHIRYMTYTTIPSIAITLVLFLVIGFSLNNTTEATDINGVLNAIDTTFNIHLGLFIVPAIVITLIVRKVPAIPALLAGILLGGIFAIIFQPQLIPVIAGNSETSFGIASFTAVMKAMYGSVSVDTPNQEVNDLLKTKGMAGMLNTIWLILSAMVYGGIMEKSGMLRKVTEKIIEVAHSTGSLIASTAGTCIFFNITASDQYIAIVVPGRMFADTYHKRGLMPENLSRTLEDSGTVTSVLVPWNTCGATQASVLGVATFTYAPFCFFNIISPFMTILFGYLQIKIRKIDPEKTLEKA